MNKNLLCVDGWLTLEDPRRGGDVAYPRLSRGTRNTYSAQGGPAVPRRIILVNPYVIEHKPCQQTKSDCLRKMIDSAAEMFYKTARLFGITVNK